MKEDEKVRPYLRFQRLARAIRICMIFKSEPDKKERDVLSDVNRYVTFKEYAEQMRQRSIGLNFNPNYYKANRQLKLSSEARKILIAQPEERTKTQIQQTLLSLRSIRSFSEYPKRMQNLLVKVCWYENHSNQKIILRQGHRPTAFYFILSGSVVVKKVTANQTFAKTVCHLKRGDSFGELSIIHSTVRQATIISETEIELLGISDSDFIRIFMTSASGGKNLHDPDFFTFVRELDFLKGWPIELLPKNQKDCLFNYFKTGSVLVKDSRYSDWIYVIKSGSCDILKELKEAPQRNRENLNDYQYTSKRHQRSKSASHQQRTATTTTTTTTYQRQQRQQQLHGLFGRKLEIQPRPKVKTKLNLDYNEQMHRILVLDNKDQEEKDEELTNDTTLNDDSQDLSDSTTRKPYFVKIRTLQKGETFGLQNMLCKNQPGLSLVSNGAEILMISKKFYSNHMTNNTRQELELNLMMYPKEEMLQKNLKIELDWRAYKNSIVDNVVKNKRCRTAHL